MAKILDLIYRVKDTASLPIKKIKTEQSELNKSLKAGKELYATTAATLTGVGVAVGKLIGDYQAFTIAAGDMAHNLGITTEEASAMIEVAGDLDIEVATLETAFKSMARNGIDPSIAGLATVRARLEEAKSPADKLKLAQELLGKAAQDLLPIFDQLTDEQLANYIESMSDARTVTEEEYQQELKNRESIADMKDAYADATLSVGGFLSNGLMPYIEILKTLPFLLQDIEDGVDGLTRGVRDGVTEVGFLQAELMGLQDREIHVNIVTTRTELAQSQATHPSQKRDDGYYWVWNGNEYERGNRWSTNPKKSGQAAGGPVEEGMSYTVGEKGAETFVPDRSGTIIPNNDVLAQAINNLVRTLPTILKDAVERSK